MGNKSFDWKGWFPIGLAVLTGGIAWGTMSARQSAQDSKIEELATVPENLATLTEQVKSVSKQTTDTQHDVRDIRNYLLSKDRDSRFRHSFP